MKRLLAFCATISLTLGCAAPAIAVEAIELQVSRLGDTELSCGGLSEEAFLMREIITTTEDIKDDSDMRGHGINAATGLGSFLIGTATGGIGLAAAGFLIGQTNKEDGANADGVQDIAKQRRGFMVGIYKAKGCYGPIEHVMQDGIELPSHAHIQIASLEPAAGEEQESDHTHKTPSYNQ